MTDTVDKEKVLVVEDEPVIANVCLRVLTDDGYEVDVAVNVLVAKKMVHDKKYDLCLTDIRTPAMSGIELYEYLAKEHPDLAKKVVFTTGDVMSGNIEEFLKMARRPFLPKPFTPDDLRKVVRQALEQGA